MQTTSVSSRDRPRLLLVIVLIPLLASCSPDVDNLFGDGSLFAVVPPGCDEVLADTVWDLSPSLTISFGNVPDLAVGRLPKGVVSAVVPIFIDPIDAESGFHADDVVKASQRYSTSNGSIQK